MQAHSLSRSDLRKRRLLRRFLYSQLAMRSAMRIALGKEDPLVMFRVEADPPSIYFVFRVTDPAGLQQAAALPAGFDLAPIRCLASDEPEVFLTLNVYRVSGITNGRRAEWSVYVDDPVQPGVPRYLVIDARSSTRSMDPVDIFTRASRVDYSPGTVVVGDPPAEFCADFDPSSGVPAVTAPEWTTANDSIYWGNGICDRTFYDGGMAAPSQVALDPTAVKITDATRWAPFIAPTPQVVLQFGAGIDFVVAPWSNLEGLR